MKQEENSKKIKFVVFSAGFLLILYNFVFFVGRNAVDVPFWDQWSIVEILAKKASLWELFQYQHNEHRIGVGLIIIKFLAIISHWSQILEIKFVSLLMISSSLVILFLKRSISKKIEILDLIIPLLFLNIFQFENIDWGFQISFILPLFFFCLWLAVLRIKNTKKRNAAFSTLSLMSAYSSFHGLILPVITIGHIAYDFFRKKSGKIGNLLFFVFLNISIIGSYFINYKRIFQPASFPGVSKKSIEYFSLAVSNGFLYPKEYSLISYFLLIITLFILAIALYEIFIKKKWHMNLVVGASSIAFALAFISIITVGRSSLGAAQALASRYVTFALLIPIGIFFIFSQYKRGVYLKLALIFFLTYNVVFLTSPIRSYTKMVTIGKQEALDCYKTSPPSKYKKCFRIFALYPDEELISKLIPKVFKIKKLF